MEAGQGSYIIQIRSIGRVADAGACKVSYGGSIPSWNSIIGELAHLVERNTCNVEAAGSKPAFSTTFCRNCDSPIESDYRFCSLSCSASFNNKERSAKGWVSPLKKTDDEITRHTKICPGCSNIFSSVRKIAKFCSNTCSSQSREKSRRANRSDFRNYQADCQFKFSLKDYPDAFDFGLIEKFGWYSAANRGGNLDGISRDHMLSISNGYAQGISPEIIRHPANCQLVQQIYNSKKHSSSSLTEDDLLKRIATWI